MKNETKSRPIAEIVSPGTILLGLRGSQAHGTYRPSTEPDSIDDVDYMGIIVPPRDYFIGLKQWGNHGTREVFEGETDLCEYEIKKFIGLLLKCNPNVHMMLFLKSYIYRDKLGQLLLDRRDIFQTKAAYHSYCGYARAQLHKMHAVAYQGYMGEKRKQLVDKFGYDTKNAQHCIRLLRQGIEYLETGWIRVDRTGVDADELVAIKRGEWSIERVIGEATSLFVKAKEAFEASTLPDEPNKEAANQLCMDIVSGTI